MIRLGFFSLFTLIFALQADAHTVPSITLEAIFSKDRSFELRVNIDPRLLVSDKPTTLPPVEAAWYREQTPDQLKATYGKAREYLLRSISLKFGGKDWPWSELTFQPMDGSTNLPLNDDTKEVHLLATLRGMAPAGNFQIALGNDATTSLILLNSFEGNAERRPQVIFAGETTRPFVLPGDGKTTATPSVTPANVPKN